MAVKIQAQREAERIWDFMNETFQGFSHSNDQEGQQWVYSGHKRAHSLNWQTIVMSDDLVFFLTDLYPGSTNDWTMWRTSECENAIQCIIKTSSDSSLLYIYGNSAYFCTYRTMCSFKNSQDRHWLDKDKKNFNAWLFSVRIAVENVFEQTQKLWTYTVFLKSLQFKWQSVTAYFAVAVLLSNCLTCIQGNSISSRFAITSLSVKNYLRYVISSLHLSQTQHSCSALSSSLEVLASLYVLFSPLVLFCLHILVSLCVLFFSALRFTVLVE